MVGLEVRGLIRDEVLDADAVEERLIEAAGLFRKMERKGRAWAGDGPWYLSQAKRDPNNWWAEQLSALEVGEDPDRVYRDPRPDRDLMARAEEAAAWLGQIANDADRKLVKLVVAQMELDGRVNWRGMLAVMGMVRGMEGLRRRYRRTLHALAISVNGL